MCVVSGCGWGGVDIISSNSIIGCCARWGVLGVQQVIIYISYCYHTVWFSGVVFIVVKRRVIYDSPYMRGHKIGSRNRRNVMWQQLLLCTVQYATTNLSQGDYDPDLSIKPVSVG